MCTGWVRPSNTLRPSTCRKKDARFHTAIRRPKKIVQLVGCWNVKIALGREDSVQIPLSPTSPLLRAFLISTLDGKMLILIASWQEPFVLAPRCRLFILENCSPFKYPHLIVPLDYVLALFYVWFFSSPTKRLTGNTSAAKEDAISSQRIIGVSAARMRTDRASREPLRGCVQEI